MGLAYLNLFLDQDRAFFRCNILLTQRECEVLCMVREKIAKNIFFARFCRRGYVKSLSTVILVVANSADHFVQSVNIGY